MISGSYISMKSANIILFIVLGLIVSSCVTKQEIKQGASTTFGVVKGGASTAFDSVKGGVGTGVGKVKSMTSGKLGVKRQTNRAEALAIAAKFPKTEMPHTMLTKPVAEGRLTSGFGFRLNPAGIPIPKGHKGVDYAAAEGTAIYAAESGVVVRKYVSTSYGNYIKIEHENGFSTAYAHMNEFANGIEEGDKVKKGQRIGGIGTTGRSTGPHLHFELHYRGKAMDPFFAKPLT